MMGVGMEHTGSTGLGWIGDKPVHAVDIAIGRTTAAELTMSEGMC